MKIFAARYKLYAAWPIVLWCRLVGHRNQPRWDFARRCLRCGDRGIPSREFVASVIQQAFIKHPEWDCDKATDAFALDLANTAIDASTALSPADGKTP